jgi:hydroxymethylpyrimidine/phosphomethylpyrimidine kinase
MRTALTIAGSDSSGGAGIQADLKTFAAFGLYGASAITAITAQSTKGIEATLALPADMVTAQIEAVAGDLTLHATKVGMLANAAIVEAVAAAIAELDLPLVVVDPVLVSSSGERLLDEDGVRALCTELFPLARVVTPNVPEAEALSGRIIHSLDDAYEAAKRIQGMGATAVIITGGHRFDEMRGAECGVRGGPSEVVDLVFDGGAFFEMRVPRVDSVHTHGTGCTFAAAIAARLALGHSLRDAVYGAKEYLTAALRGAYAIGRGHGPVDHLHPLTRR